MAKEHIISLYYATVFTKKCLESWNDCLVVNYIFTLLFYVQDFIMQPTLIHYGQ